MGSGSRLGAVFAKAPAFVIGRDTLGHWLAVEIHGLGGGLFATREAAFVYARAETGRRPDAVRYVSRPISLT